MSVLLTDGRKNLKDAIRHILDTFLTKVDYTRGIFIKPNIVFPVTQRSNEITSLSFVEALVTTLKERHSNIDIIIGEGVAAGCDPSNNFQISGYSRLARKLDVPLIDLNCADRKAVAWKFGTIKLPVVALERTYINLPILKPSSACVISGALKNQKGLVLPGVKKQFHRHGLHEQIAELNVVIQPTLTIMDCSRFLGRNMLISGNNCGEIDATACRLLGIDEPEHVKLSRSACIFAQEFTVDGDKINPRHVSNRLKVKEFKRYGRLRLWSNAQACSMCRYVFHDIQHELIRPKNILARIKLLAHSLKGAEIIMGTNPQWRQQYPTMICFGECTRRIAKEGGFTHIPGCPPTPDDFFDNLP